MHNYNYDINRNREQNTWINTNESSNKLGESIAYKNYKIPEADINKNLASQQLIG